MALMIVIVALVVLMNPLSLLQPNLGQPGGTTTSSDGPPVPTTTTETTTLPNDVVTTITTVYSLADATTTETTTLPNDVVTTITTVQSFSALTNSSSMATTTVTAPGTNQTTTSSFTRTTTYTTPSTVYSTKASTTTLTSLSTVTSYSTVSSTSSTGTSNSSLANGSFGWSVSLSGNYAIVGAPNQASGGFTHAGMAYVFNAVTGGLVATLSSPTPQSGGSFGWSVSISGNFAVVGAPFENASGKVSAGNAYIFNAGTGTLIATLASPNVGVNGEFGWSVSAAGKYVLVGAPFESSGPVGGAGNAYVFGAVTGGLLTNLTSLNPQSGGNFGYSVEATTKYAVIGAPLETSGSLPFVGNTYVFNALTGTSIANLTSPNPVSGGHFGWSVAVSSDYVVVGAPTETSLGRAHAGNAYIFNATSGALIAPLTSPVPTESGHFGFSLSTDTVNSTFAIVGAPNENSGGHLAAGNSYVFSAVTGSLLSNLTSPAPQANGNFGWSVSISGSIGSSGSFALVGAPNEASGGQSSAGNSYMFNAATGILVITLTSPGLVTSGRPQLQEETSSLPSEVRGTPLLILLPIGLVVKTRALRKSGTRRERTGLMCL